MTRAKRTESVAWECVACGRRHLWRWTPDDIDPAGSIVMQCDSQHHETVGHLVRIGRNAWALKWHPMWRK